MIEGDSKNQTVTVKASSGDVHINFATSFSCSSLAVNCLKLLASQVRKIPGMEVAGAAVGAVLGTICNLLCGCVNSKMTTTLKLRSNLDVLVKELKSLVDLRVDVKNEKKQLRKKET